MKDNRDIVITTSIALQLKNTGVSGPMTIFLLLYDVRLSHINKDYLLTYL